MKRNELIPKFTAATLAVLFGFFLLYGQLSSSDFPRYTYQPPPVYDPNADGLYQEMGQCGFNQIWNAHQGYAVGQPGAYLEALYDNGMRAVLMKKGSPPFLIETYSYGQHHQYEADWDYVDAHNAGLPGWYFFRHGENSGDTVGVSVTFPLENITAWQCRAGVDDPDVFLHGPGEYVYGPDALGGWRAQTPHSKNETTLGFLSVFRVRADITGLSDTDSVFRAEVYQKFNDINGDGMYRTLLDTGFLAQSFTDEQWIRLEAGYTVVDTVYYSVEDTTQDLNGAHYTRYRLSWQGNCDLWVDWIEFMDSTRAYYLFYKDPQTGEYAYRGEKWDSIYAECDDLETDYSDELYAWRHSDEPRRSIWDAHRVMVDSARATLQFPPITTFYQNVTTSRCSVFVHTVEPDIFCADMYVFRDDDDTGGYPPGQAELDSLAHVLEYSFGAAHLKDPPIQLYVTLQAHMQIRNYYDYDPSNDYLRERSPTAGELRASAYLALAHGAKGIGFWKYTSSRRGDASKHYNEGLVDTIDYSHSSDLWASKWATVQQINAQLDSIGDVLLSLERDTAFCARDGGFISPLENVYFEEESQDSAWIEVGQFDSSGTKFLILVNRRTDADRHISVFTTYADSAGEVVMEDIYTREEFASQRGAFRHIPFEAGEGRIFKLPASK